MILSVAALVANVCVIHIYGYAPSAEIPKSWRVIVCGFLAKVVFYGGMPCHALPRKSQNLQTTDSEANQEDTDENSQERPHTSALKLEAVHGPYTMDWQDVANILDRTCLLVFCVLCTSMSFLHYFFL